MTDPDWSRIHSREQSWRAKLQGDFVAEYVLDRYLDLFDSQFRDEPPQSFLELGAGNGDLSKRILQSRFPFVERYVVSENFEKGVEWLSGEGFEALRLDAQKIDLPDNSFDTVLSFDVMHHVDDPARMASEMLRVAKKRVLLTEANGLSLGRKIFEISPGHRAAGERSYLPSTYIGFFRQVKGFRLTGIKMFPFLFVFKTPSFAAPAVVAFSRAMENIPLLRFQCATVCIDISFERVK